MIFSATQRAININEFQLDLNFRTICTQSARVNLGQG